MNSQGTGHSLLPCEESMGTQTREGGQGQVERRRVYNTTDIIIQVSTLPLAGQ